MTRDEAITRVFTHAPNWNGDAAGLVEALAVFDLLKLDEPKSAAQKFREQVKNENLAAYDAEIYLGAIERAGLKIVEA